MMRFFSGMLIMILLSSCERVTYNDLEPVVERDLVIFSDQIVPGALLDEADQYSIIILGETHYVQEHQEWGSLLLENLLEGGYTVFLNELSHASGWMVNDYVHGELDQLPERIRFFDNEWLENIRQINSVLEQGEKIRFYYMDVNHTIDDFRYSLLEIEKILGTQPLFQRVLNDPYNSDSYRVSLLELRDKLQERENELIQSLGEKWYNRIVDLVEFEIPSRDYRFNNEESLRENTMFNIITKILDTHSGKKAVINAGMFHAQKITLMGFDIPRIAQLLDIEYPGDVFSISFNGIRGVSKNNFYDKGEVDIDLIDNTAKRDLMHVIGVKSDGMMSFLRLDDPVFRKDMKVTYTKTDTKTLAPGLQFDAVITYPEISILNSMGEFEN